MFLNKYLNEVYLNMLYENYEEWYLNSINEENFIKVYNLLKEYNFYFIKDIIIYHLELFECNVEDIKKNILKLKEKLGDNFVFEIGNNLTYLEELLPQDTEEDN